ncbi:MAG: PAS domain-containing protein [Chitinophagales bacterium]|nr:PAS domain-containing protein [Chitinophagales bacterium]
MSVNPHQSDFGDVKFQIIFESLPGSCLVLSPDFTIVAVTDMYLHDTMTKRDEIIGKNIFDVFPDNPHDAIADGVSNLKLSLNFVLQNKTAHSMAVQKYDIRREDGVFEVRYWSPLNKPVLNNNNEVIYIIHRAEDVTEYIRLQQEYRETGKLASDLQSRTFELESEILNRSHEIQKLNQELEQKVIQRSSQLQEVTKAIADYKFALDESSIVAITDQTGVIKWANDNFCKISKYTRQELLGQDHRIINSAYHSKEFIRNLWTTIANGKIWKGEIRNKAKDGTLYWVDTTIVPFLDEKGKPYQYIAIRSDITQRKLAEEQLLKLNEELEEKVRERTLELAELLQREKELSEMKSRFVSTAAHEFRTPLSAILSSISLVERYVDPEHFEKRTKHINRIKSSIRNLTDILNDFLSLDKLEQGKVEVECNNINLKQFCLDIAEDMKGILKQGQTLQHIHSGEDEIYQDKKILRNVLMNLLSNAVKYSPEGKAIHLHTEIDKNNVAIKVKDNGIGIPIEEQKHLFSKFFRAKNAADIQGTGLGLNIVQRYVELLDGKINFESVPGEGTVFIVEFPKNN